MKHVGEESLESLTPAEEFGSEVRHARVAHGWTQTQLAHRLHFQQPYVSRVEQGKVLASADFADQCDRVFGTPGTFARWRQRAADAGTPVWFIPYLELERKATAIRSFSSIFVMGILQTPEYAEAVYRAAHPEETSTQIKDRVDRRMRRRELLDKAAPPSIWAILHESVLWSGVGGPEVMREQLRHLVAVSEHPRIDVQVFPVSSGSPPWGRPFIVLSQQDGTDVLYEETYERGRMTNTVEAVRGARTAYERLCADALPRHDSLALIRHVMEAYSHESHPRPLSRDMGEVFSQRRLRRMPRMGPRTRGYRHRPHKGQ
ncbi:helix-turn-helix transcriptional regulator [Streptomyces sp. UNOC14_S4]|uniref:helix-turn-helix domain-containing protein n=1 Tax=Streptomyces sp. UNOC14_S4 TaxID=2872340 RepID=UPI0027E36AF3|nr:helix-turn-helix transcriptional regulator [Streptomyces sp. UNOC14_S4]MCC3766987.1 helix-turn-helix transcriptional regulator [Streptomyces sp. UNOC14_S4]